MRILDKNLIAAVSGAGLLFSASGAFAAACTPADNGVTFVPTNQCLTTINSNGFSTIQINGAPAATSGDETFSEIGNLFLGDTLGGPFANGYATYTISGSGKWNTVNAPNKFTFSIDATQSVSAVVTVFLGTSTESFKLPTSVSDATFGVTNGGSTKIGTASLDGKNISGSVILNTNGAHTAATTVSASTFDALLDYTPEALFAAIFNPETFQLDSAETATGTNQTLTVGGGKTDVNIGKNATSNTPATPAVAQLTFIPVAVPEPAPLLTFGLGLLGLGLIRRRVSK